MMDRNEARICLDGANAFLQHTPMKIRDLNRISDAYNVLRNAINGLEQDSIATEWEKYYRVVRTNNVNQGQD